MERIEKLIELIRPYYLAGKDPAHDWAHVGRVAATTRKLCEEEGANLEYTLAAVYCHDIVNLPKNHPMRRNASALAARKASPHLEAAGFAQKEIDIICTAIIEHSFSRGEKPSCKESAILQDADRLDTLGAIGILRCASVNTQMKGNFYDPIDPLAQDRKLDDRAYMLDHYFTKLFDLHGMMNTQSGRVLAQERTEIMKGFVSALMREIR